MPLLWELWLLVAGCCRALRVRAYVLACICFEKSKWEKFNVLESPLLPTLLPDLYTHTYLDDMRVFVSFSCVFVRATMCIVYAYSCTTHTFWNQQTKFSFEWNHVCIRKTNLDPMELHICRMDCKLANLIKYKYYERNKSVIGFKLNFKTLFEESRRKNL